MKAIANTKSQEEEISLAQRDSPRETKQGALIACTRTSVVTGIGTVAATSGDIDILVNSAGAIPRGTLLEIDEELLTLCQNDQPAVQNCLDVLVFAAERSKDRLGPKQGADDGRLADFRRVDRTGCSAR